MTRHCILALALTATSCGPLVQVGGNAPKPDVLYTLSAVTPAAPNAASSGRVVVVSAPAVVGALQTLRVPVALGDTRIQYLTGASWVEAPAKLLQRVLIDRMNGAGLVAVGPGAMGDPQRIVGGTLRSFGLDARTPGAFRAVARLDAVLTDPDGKLIATRSFEAAEALADDQPRTVIDGLNRAANRMAGDMAAWAAGA